MKTNKKVIRVYFRMKRGSRASLLAHTPNKRELRASRACTLPSDEADKGVQPLMYRANEETKGIIPFDKHYTKSHKPE